MKALIGSAVLLLGLSSAILTGSGLKNLDTNINEPNPYILELSKMNEVELITLCEKLATKKKNDKNSDDLENKLLNGCDEKINQLKNKDYAKELKNAIETELK